jgi:hypothetical protein
MVWQIHIETASPDDVTGYQEEFNRTIELLATHLAMGDIDHNGWNIYLNSTVPDPVPACLQAISAVRLVVQLTGLPLWRIVRVAATDMEYVFASK